MKIQYLGEKMKTVLRKIFIVVRVYRKNYGSKIYKIFVIDLQIFHLFQIADIAMYHTMKYKQFKRLRS